MPNSKFLKALPLLGLICVWGCTDYCTTDVVQPCSDLVSPTAAPPSPLEIEVQNAQGTPHRGLPYRLIQAGQLIYEGQSNAQGRLDLPQLPGPMQGAEDSSPAIAPRYQLELGTAPHLQRRQLQLPEQGGLIRLVYEPAPAEVQGRILSQSGEGVDQAVVQLNGAVVLSNARGEFHLPAPENRQGALLRIAATGYRTQEHELQGSETAAQIKLEPLSLSRRLRWPAHARWLGLSEQAWQDQTQSLRQIAVAQGLEPLPLETSETLNPERDLLLLMPPQKAFSVQQTRQWQSFVQAGGKLVVLSEWAGFAQAPPAHLAPFLHSLGFYSGHDSLSQSAQYLEITAFTEHALSAGLNGLRFYRSSTAGIGELRHGDELAFAPAAHFQVLNRGPHPVLAAGLVGLGKVVVAGDASWILNRDSDGDGVMNVSEADNARLWQNILGW